MNIMDSCPERRNFTLINLVTITYFWADGEINNGNITIPFVNIILHDSTNALIIFLAIFAWFTFRYWLVFKSEPYSYDHKLDSSKRIKKWQKAFLAAINEKTLPSKWLTKMRETDELKNDLQQHMKGSRGYEVSDNNFRSYISERKLYVGYKDPNSHLHYRELMGLKKWPLIILLVLKSFFSDPFLPTWYLPWFMNFICLGFLLHAGWNYE